MGNKNRFVLSLVICFGPPGALCGVWSHMSTQLEEVLAFSDAGHG